MNQEIAWKIVNALIDDPVVLENFRAFVTTLGSDPLPASGVSPGFNYGAAILESINHWSHSTSNPTPFKLADTLRYADFRHASDRILQAFRSK